MDKELMINYKHYNKKSINKNIDDYNATYNEGNSQNGNTFKSILIFRMKSHSINYRASFDYLLNRKKYGSQY